MKSGYVGRGGGWSAGTRWRSPKLYMPHFDQLYEFLDTSICGMTGDRYLRI